MAGNPITNANSRIWLIDGRARPNNQPSFEDCTRMTGIDQALGDITKIECPDPASYGKFIEVGQIKGEIGRATTELISHYLRNRTSTLLTLAQKGCSFDFQAHMGACQDPRRFTDFDKIVIFEGANFTNYSTDELGTLASSDQAEVNETAAVSIKNYYEVVKLALASRAGDNVTNEVLDVVICDNISCGECATESDGCQKIFAITKAAGGSPSTPADIVYSLDSGVVFYAHDIDSLGIAEDPSAIACVGQYIVVVSNDSGSLHYALKSEMDGVTDPTWTEVTTGFVTGGEPNDIWSDGNTAFIVGDGGYVYSLTDPTAGVTVLDAGVAVVDDLNAVHGLSDEFFVGVGDSGAVVKSEDGVTVTAVTPRPTGAGVHLTAVWAKDENQWWVGSSTGLLRYTLNAGTTYTTKTIPGTAAARVDDIAFASDSIMYVAYSTATPAGRIARSYDGGYSLVVMPEGSGNFPANDRINAIAVCENNVNFIVGVGLADDASDGFIVVGNA